MAIKLKSKNVSVDVEDEKGEVIGKVTFNPDDIGTYNAIMAIGDEIYKIDDKYKGVGEIKDIPTGELTEPKDFDEVRTTLNKVIDFTSYTVEHVDKIAKEIDKVFGEGTSELIMQGGHDIENLQAFLEGITPYFKDAHDKRINKYVEDEKEGDVM